MKEGLYMYIMSTNFQMDSTDFNSRIPASIITSERYFNCENFFADMNQKRRKLFHKNKADKKR